MTKGQRVRIIAGRYDGQFATLQKRIAGSSNEWVIVLDDSYNHGIVNAVDIEPLNKTIRQQAEAKAKKTGGVVIACSSHAQVARESRKYDSFEFYSPVSLGSKTRLFIGYPHHNQTQTTKPARMG